ncbi:putative hydrolase [Microlunatus phosphovorus NM-1]|uniref:Putative hydrolase n=1 Tax=Microlunatus phosphovorus (strain ATCC 700054 / DSM 10555 / JCM 9379 / NBRC 101784 / NCIMB 13414 / VKM Ac-1990 / NM-1) TaxID=1032480 RepID=F5XRG4_MICPN|nr:dienelactone hydrolase family protein [Microlunatus phosphovorus]BAK34654.1 putative hydrolase [Microlunatus phosphovorus NM-1]
METVTEDVTIGDRMAVSARPAGAGRWPGVVMLHEGYGINEVLRRQAQRLASAGYLVVAPDLLGDGQRYDALKSALESLTARQGTPFEVIAQSRTWVIDRRECNGKVGVIGFGLGGGYALAVAGSGFDAAAVNYAVIPEDAIELLRGSCPIVGSYGAKDRLSGGITKLAAALEEHQIDYDLKVYRRAGHSFLNDVPVGPVLLRPMMKIASVGPEPESAKHAWGRIESFFGRHLRG